MENVFDVNGLVFWSEDEIKLRNFMIETFARRVQGILLDQNPAWRFFQIEAPLLTPRRLLNQNYTSGDIFDQTNDPVIEQVNGTTSITPSGAEPLALRPETTPGSYAYATHLMKHFHQNGVKPPLCVWQAGKSFRREQDQVSKNMRFKEFWQQEFQSIYASDTLNDYHTRVLGPVSKMIHDMIGLPTRVIPSDRLPAYSQITMDVEVDNGEKWMEVCSISRRTDFPEKLRFHNNKGSILEKDALVLEIAIGLDRCLYCYDRRTNFHAQAESLHDRVD